MDIAEIKQAVEAQTGQLIAVRRDFHRHPEIAFEETRTAGIVAKKLQELNFDQVQTGVAKTGVVGLLRGGKPGKTVMVRADMDALPMIEETTAEYKSQTHGKMHACGHDAHTAIAMTVAEILAQHRAELPGMVKFVFQPAEEIVGGAVMMKNEGVLDNPRPSACFALHMGNNAHAGTIGTRVGAHFASTDSFAIKISGKGGHGSMPERSIDPIVCAAAVVNSLNTILSREIPASDRIAFTFGTIKGGFAPNIIAPEVSLTGTVRAFAKNLRDFVLQRIEEISTGVAIAMRCRAEMQIVFSTGACASDAKMVEYTRNAALAMLGESEVYEMGYGMASDDMSVFLDEIPGCYFSLGSGKTDGSSFPHHHPGFDIVESSLPVGAQVMTKLVWDYLNRNN
jgi:amidohydrolase